MGCYFLEQISFGDIPNSRNLLFLQIFPQRAVKPSAGNISARSAPKLPGTLLNLIWLCTRRSPVPSGTGWTWPGSLHQSPRRPSPEPCWTWPGSAPKPPFSGTFSGTLNLLRNPVELDPALHQSLPDLLLNLWNPVEADLALHQSLPNLHRKLLRNAAEPDLALHQSLPGLLRNLLRNMTWLCTKASQTFTAIFSPEPYPEPYWTWPGSAPKPPRPSPSPEPCWTWPGHARLNRSCGLTVGQFHRQNIVL